MGFDFLVAAGSFTTLGIFIEFLGSQSYSFAWFTSTKTGSNVMSEGYFFGFEVKCESGSVEGVSRIFDCPTIKFGFGCSRVFKWRLGDTIFSRVCSLPICLFAGWSFLALTHSVCNPSSSISVLKTVFIFNGSVLNDTTDSFAIFNASTSLLRICLFSTLWVLMCRWRLVDNFFCLFERTILSKRMLVDSESLLVISVCMLTVGWFSDLRSCGMSTFDNRIIQFFRTVIPIISISLEKLELWDLCLVILKSNDGDFAFFFVFRE